MDWQPISTAPKVDSEPEPIVMTVTLGLLMDAGNWTKACDLLGLNPWCMNEGLADRNTTQGLTRSQATALGFIR